MSDPGEAARGSGSPATSNGCTVVTVNYLKTKCVSTATTTSWEPVADACATLIDSARLSNCSALCLDWNCVIVVDLELDICEISDLL